jgi:ATP-dependent DNA helicase RecG
LLQVHFPDSQSSLEAARKRLAFDELFLLQLGLLKQKQQWRAETGRAFAVDASLLSAFIQSLPYPLTDAQRRVITEIVQDLRTDRPMSRLLQGDVGSGKTAVAAAAMFLAAQSGYQAAIMAPTEILAEQHFRNLTSLFAPINQRGIPHPINVRLLTGSTPTADRETILAEIAAGGVNVVVGTHALIQETVTFHDLALAVVDEQHRFGVAQRAALRQKGFNPHVLVMTATPIPRTLALTLYGDLDLSVIDQLPPGRQPIETRIILPTERERAYAFIRTQIEKGQQAYIICPLVEESDKIEAKAAIDEHARLQKHVFPHFQLGLLHGRLKPGEKDEAMRAFANNDTQILVSTSVVEVGIDVPNATTIMIEGAERFGLSQLHQFRGRVGRGEHQSYCLLQTDAIASDISERLKAVESTNDGFVLAEKDLELRGPGQFFGTRQSGLPDMHLTTVTDARLIDLARREAETLLAHDPELSVAENQLLAQRLSEFWKSGQGDLS